MAAAQDQPARRDHAVDALLAREPRIFFDAVDRHFGSAAEHREHRAIPQEIDGIVAPLAIGDHAPVQIQNAIEFEAIERHPAWQSTRSGIASRCAILAWIGFLRHRTHAASPVITGMILFRKPDSTFRDHAENYMIAPTAGRCKRPVAARPKFVRGGLSWGRWTRKKGRHGIVSGNHNTAQLPPSDRPSGLRKENPALARSFRFRIPQPPAPRGRRDRACSQVVYPHTGPTKVGPFSFWGSFLGLSFRGAR